jgi:hypothetical protein
VATDLATRIDQLRATLRSGRSVNVNSKTIKSDIIQLAKEYFQNVRPQVSSSIPEKALQTYDAYWQDLVRLAHGNNSRRSYIRLLTALKKATVEINVSQIIQSGPESAGQEAVYTDAEAVLVYTLERLAPSAAQSYQQAIQDLAAPVQRLSYRGTATDLREAFRDVLDQLAPDATVMQQSDFALEKGQTQSTMKQKVRFILRSRGKSSTHRAVAEKSVELIEALSGDIARAFYNRASLSTHVETTYSEARQLKRYVDTLLFDLLEIR